jgi:hypothetical protein
LVLKPHLSQVRKKNITTQISLRDEIGLPLIGGKVEQIVLIKTRLIVLTRNESEQTLLVSK